MDDTLAVIVFIICQFSKGGVSISVKDPMKTTHDAADIGTPNQAYIG